MRELRRKFPDADMAEIAKMASVEALSKQQKSRAFYRIQATRMLTGAGNILNKTKQEVVVVSLWYFLNRKRIKVRLFVKFSAFNPLLNKFINFEKLFVRKFLHTFF